MTEDEKQMLKDSILTRAEMRHHASERIYEIAKEFTEGFEFLSSYPKSATFFGSTESPEDSFYYKKARELSYRLVKELDYSVVSGGGPGIMEAADRGASEAGGNSLGLLIDLPNVQHTNPYVTQGLNFHYFFARKVCLTFGAEIFIFFPGGFGTLDEFFELLTLIQTKKIQDIPLVCFGTEYWNSLKNFMKTEMMSHDRLLRDAIRPEDLDLFTITDDLDEIVAIARRTRVREDIPVETKS
jgi:uncharacterized protein (TIGR00730 family)